jgi:hypothetical protein
VHRRAFLAGLGALVAGPAPAAGGLPTVQVYKNPSCDCCRKWVLHLRANGFEAVVNDVPDTGEYRTRFGMPDRLGACHSARVGGYAVEGHVPAADIRRLLAERLDAAGLAVPAMPPGSPGMEGPPPQAYDVFLVHRDGSFGVYRHYSGG